MIEPLPANNGLLVQRPEFLNGLRKLCDAHGALLVFDEVISGFRFKREYGDLCGVTPDITALGKVIGGGLPVGLRREPKSWRNSRRLVPSIKPVRSRQSAGHGRRRYDTGHARRSRLRPYGRTRCAVGRTHGSVLAKHGHPMRLVRMESLFCSHPATAHLPYVPTKSRRMRARCMPMSTVHCSTEAT